MDATEKRGARQHPGRSLLWGGIGALLFMLLLLLCALGIGHQWIGQGREAAVGRVALFLSAAAAGYLSGRNAMDAKALHCAGSIGSMAVLLVLTSFLMGVSSPINISLFLSLLCLISGGFAGCLLSVGRKGGRRKRKRMIT